MPRELAEYQELASMKRVFQAANQAATTTSVGLTATNLGLCLSNPVASTVNLVLLQMGVSVIGAPAALSAIGIQGGWIAAGVVTHTTALTPQITYLGETGGTCQGKADAAATTVGTPVILMPLGVTPVTGATAQVVNPQVVLNYYDFKGAFVIAPGGWISLYTSAALSVIAGITWAEVAR